MGRRNAKRKKKRMGKRKMWKRTGVEKRKEVRKRKRMGKGRCGRGEEWRRSR